jgi:hypothetical protein
MGGKRLTMLDEAGRKARKAEQDKAYYLRNKAKINAQTREWYAENKEKVRAEWKAKYAQDTEFRENEKARTNDWRAENKERKSIADKKWKDANKQKRAEIDRLWVESNRELVRQYKKKWQDDNKAYMAEYHARLRSLRLQRTPLWLTKEDIEKIRNIYELAIKKTKETGTFWHVDHIVPLQGKNVSGLHVPQNLRVITADENRRKSNKWEV